MNKYVAVHFREFAASANEFDTLAEAHNHLLFKSSLIPVDKMDLMAVYRKSDGQLVGTVHPLSAPQSQPYGAMLSEAFKSLF